MDAAIKIHKQARQGEITRLERSTMRETTITDVNEMSLKKLTSCQEETTDSTAP